MNKICTDIKQSKKLIELGIDVNTADMYYMYRHWEIDENTIGSQSDASIGFDSDFYYSANNGKTYHYIPAWSLAALLEAMPQSITKYIESERCQKTFCLNLFRSYYHCCSYCTKSSVSDDDGDNTLYCFGRDSWVDACVAMIEKLYKLNLL